VLGQGRHRIMDVETAFNAHDGFEIDSDRNVLKNDTAIQNGSDGFRAHRERNVVKKNLAGDNGSFGFSVDGHSHRIVRNEAIDNADGGLRVAPNGGLGPSRIVRNVLSSGGPFDIVASQQVCEENVFKRNLFGIASSPCVQ